MRTQPLSPQTRRHIEVLFAADDRCEAERLLIEECGTNLPFLGNFDQFQLERFRFAALELSEGSLADLRQAVALAKTDWRDLLMSAGFGEDVHAHEHWQPGLRSG